MVLGWWWNYFGLGNLSQFMTAESASQPTSIQAFEHGFTVGKSWGRPPPFNGTYGFNHQTSRKHYENTLQRGSDDQIWYSNGSDEATELKTVVFSIKYRGFHGLCSLHPILELRHSSWELDSRAGWEKKPYEKHVHQLQCGPSQLCFGGLQPPIHKSFFYIFLYLISYNYHKPSYP